MMIPTTTERKPTPAFRHEFKHVISAADDMLLVSRLKHIFLHDAHADANGRYLVTSLYFDTPDDRALNEKFDGLYGREKFRLRYYQQESGKVFLEKKLKRGGVSHKSWAQLTRNQVEAILSGETDFLLYDNNRLLQEFYSKWRGQLLRPKVVVRYQREAFTWLPGRVRITFDRRLCRLASLRDFQVTDRPVATLDCSAGQTILEVKYDGFLPDLVQAAVQIPNRMAGAWSKYAACRQFG